jgi:type 1 glutamine amidotransferase
MFRSRWVLSLVSVAATLTFSRPALLAAEPAPAQDKIRAVIVTGGHGYDAKNFAVLLQSVEDVTFEIRADKDPNALFDDIQDWKHHVVILYNLTPGITERQRENLLTLLEKGVGLVVWHHALADYSVWPEFEKIAGARYWMKAGQRDGVPVPGSGARNNVKLKMKIEDSDHPITRGVTDFEIVDEPYVRQTFVPDNRILVSTDNPASDKPIAWLPKYGKARIFSYQSGHDAKVWSHDSFRKLWSQGIRWAAGRLG